jgi:predicted Zn-ribbon and HTH transcriptional regulator
LQTKLKHTFCALVTFSENRAVYDNVEKYDKARDATDDSLAHVHCKVDTCGYNHTLGIFLFTLISNQKTSLHRFL